MKLQMFTIFDAKALVYLKPFYDHTIGSALRSFQDEANKPDSKLCIHAEDFILYHIGEFDDGDCTINIYPAHIPMGKAIEFKNQPVPQPYPHVDFTPDQQKQIDDLRGSFSTPTQE